MTSILTEEEARKRIGVHVTIPSFSDFELTACAEPVEIVSVCVDALLKAVSKEK